MPLEKLSEKQFKMYIKHLYMAKAPNQDDLMDEKYIKFIQDVVDVYGIIHNRYIRTQEGKSTFRLLRNLLCFYFNHSIF